jgi:tetratricopeptide (TPR) repeat protein
LNLNALAYYNRAVLKSNLGDINDAIKDFDKVLQINPQNLNAVFNRAKLKQSRNDFQGALKDYNKTLDLYPHFLEAYFNRSILKKAMGDIVGANQDYSMGKHISDMNHKANPDHVQQDAIAIEPLLKLSATFEKLDANALKSIDNNALLPLIVIGIKDTTRNNFPEYSSLLATLSAGGQPSYSFKMEAETHIPKDGVSLKKINTNKQTDTLLRMAVRELNDKENASAILHSTEAITKKPNNEIAFFIRALAELSEAKHPEKEKVALQFKEDVSQKYKKALLDFNNTIHLEPTFAFAYYNRAFVKCKLLDLEGAISDYNMAIQMNEGVAAFYFNKALVHFYLKENSQACQALSKAGELGLANAYPLIKLYCH